MMDGERRYPEPVFRNPFLNTDGEEVFRDSFAVYLDSLGTKVRTDGMTDEELREHLDTLRHFKQFLHNDRWNDDNRQGFLQFSDNLILGAPINARYAYADLIFLVSSVMAYQFNLAARGILLRGGIARGLLYMDRDFVFGQAINEAAEIEKQGGPPRVTLSQDCLNLVMTDSEWDATLHPVWGEALLADSDGQVFLNYLMTIEDDGIPEDIERGLIAHRALIVEGLERFGEDAGIREKYVWLAHYHNFVINEFYRPEQWALIGHPTLTETEVNSPRSFQRFTRPT